MVAAQLTAHVHSMTSATSRLSTLPQHPMSHLRVIFLIALVLFFCSLFIASYIWMRRPNFGQLEGGRRMAKATGAGVQEAETREGMAEGLIRMDPSDRRGPR
jgi:hypothetical protein